MFDIKKFLFRNKKDQTKSFYSISQTCQIPKLDIIFENFFGKINDGCFVEVGAYDGEYTSNTCGLADIGWKGYYIEPVPEYYKKCKKRHENNDVVVSNHAIGAENKDIEINSGGPLSTIRDDIQVLFQSLSWARSCFDNTTKIPIKMVTLEQYLNEHNVPQNFELLNIDVEGFEWEVLQNFEIQKWKPQMVIIELHDSNPDYKIIKNQCLNLVNYFQLHNYKIVFKDLSNTVYVTEDLYYQQK